jgi:hypothetical protein
VSAAAGCTRHRRLPIWIIIAGLVFLVPLWLGIVPASSPEALLRCHGKARTLNMRTQSTPNGDLRKARGHWVARDTIGWNINAEDVTAFKLHYDLEGGLALGLRGVEGGVETVLTVDDQGLSVEVIARFLHLRKYAALKIGPDALGEVGTALSRALSMVYTTIPMRRRGAWILCKKRPFCSSATGFV